MSAVVRGAYIVSAFEGCRASSSTTRRHASTGSGRDPATQHADHEYDVIVTNIHIICIDLSHPNFTGYSHHRYNELLAVSKKFVIGE